MFDIIRIDDLINGNSDYLRFLNDAMVLNVQHASGKKFQDILEEAFVRPLNVEGEFYIGIPPGMIH